MKIKLPGRQSTRCMADPLADPQSPRRRSTAWPLPPPMWWPIALSDADPSGPAAIDWERTLAYRRHLLDLGFGIAEAMDTSQRGMGLDWPSALELIKRSLADAGPRAGTDLFGLRHGPA